MNPYRVRGHLRSQVEILSPRSTSRSLPCFLWLHCAFRSCQKFNVLSIKSIPFNGSGIGQLLKKHLFVHLHFRTRPIRHDKNVLRDSSNGISHFWFVKVRIGGAVAADFSPVIRTTILMLSPPGKCGKTRILSDKTGTTNNLRINVF